MHLNYDFLQHYWWAVISLLGGLLVFMMFVQGGQGLLYAAGHNTHRRNLIIASLKTKWAITFTTLVTFGGAAFASFPLFYSTSFGGAFYLWLLILVLFVIQAVAFEFRHMPSNSFGDKTYDWLLTINGIGGTFLLGVAVGMFFTGGDFTVDSAGILVPAGDTSISRWESPWHGLEAIADVTNFTMGITVLLLARVLALQYFINDISDHEVETWSRKMLRWYGAIFIAVFVYLIYRIMTMVGVGTTNGIIHIEAKKYLHNIVQMPFVAILFLTSVSAVIYGIVIDSFSQFRNGIWFSGAGTIVTVALLIVLTGFHDTAYFRSLVDMADSLTIQNSSSSRFTLKTMFYASMMIPFVVAYIWYVWKAMNRKKTSAKTLTEEGY